MTELSYAPLQTVAPGQNVLFLGDCACGGRCIRHRAGSGLITLKGPSNQCRAQYRVSFGANLAVPTGGAPGEISVALAIDGETVAATERIVTPTAAEAFFAVAFDKDVDVPAGCCATISVKNTSEQTINVQNANIIVERVA